MARTKKPGEGAKAAGSSKNRGLASGEGSSEGIKVSESQLLRSETTDAGARQLACLSYQIEATNCWKKKVEGSEPDDEGDDSGSDDGDVPLPALKSRNGAYQLVKALRSMNDRQRNVVSEMGFGLLFRLDPPKELPTKLCYWLLENFEPRSCELILTDGRRLQVDPADVEPVLGLRSGGVLIERKTRGETVDLVEQWRLLYKDGKPNRTATSVIDSMLARTDGDVWFKRLFLIAMSACLMDVASNGYVSTGIMGNFENPDNAVNLNWGEFLIRCLVDHTITWKKNKTDKFYMGPILFLLGLYVDRVVDCYRSVDRTYPVMAGWSSKKLYDRQKTERENGGFGGGRIYDRLERPDNLPELERIGVQGGSVQADRSNEGCSGVSGNEPVDGRVFAANILKQAKLVADAVKGIVSMVESASPELYDSVHFHKGIETTEKLLGCRIARPPGSCTQDPTQISMTQEDEAYWADPTVMLIIEAIEEAMPKKDKIMPYVDDSPDYDLGIPLTPVVGRGSAASKHGAHQQQTETSIGVDDIETSLHDDREDATGPIPSDYMSKSESTLRSIPEDQPTNQDLGTDVGVVDKRNENKVDKVDKGKTKVADDGAEAEEHGKRKRSTRLNPATEGQNVVADNVRRASREEKGKSTEDDSNNPDDDDFMESDVPEGGRVVKRKRSGAGKSPFQTRAVDSNEYIVREDKELCYWIMNNIDLSREEVVFATGDLEIQREDFISMGAGVYINATIIDIWCKVLNHKESLRAPSSPCRLFLPTSACAGCVFGGGDWTMGQRQALFNDNLNAEIRTVDGLNVKAIDMLFFPICQSDHFYVICFDLKLRHAEILDNSPSLEDADITVKYSHIPTTLTFLESNGINIKAQFLKKLKFDRLKMHWRDESNRVDCGVYAMRHMETYMGGSLKSWRCGLSKNNQRTMKYLRVRYTAALLGSEINTHRDRVVAEAKKYYTKKIGCKAIGVDQLLIVNAAGDPL
ncbi:hypothetical protein CASFOL_005128 [Castilleja foliolosa]|uniref:Ubiquitin-like protease family profile domain-containing protein n=1 Tax=Castilleja foliolosa TaxID=1961234 RepID=A0ABD3E2I2_9LAMI